MVEYHLLNYVLIMVVRENKIYEPLEILSYMWCNLNP